MELVGKKINFLGDSITEGVGVSDKEHIFLNLLKREEGLAEARNYGWSATRIARQIGNDPYNGICYADRYESMKADADAVVVFGGTNDFGHGDAPLGTFAAVLRKPITEPAMC